MKDLKTLSNLEFKEFFDSFDQVISDVDGVIWKSFTALPGSAACIDTFKDLGKNVKLVTNCGSYCDSNYQAILDRNEVNLKVGQDVVNPLHAIIDYLKEIKFNKKLFLIGFDDQKEEIEKAGFVVTKCSMDKVESVADILEKTKDDTDIGGVLFDFSLNLHLITLQRVLTYLKRKECLFMVGAADKTVPFANDNLMIFNYHYLQLLRELSGREYIQFSKPSMNFKTFVINRFNITQPEKILFIGDSIIEDVQFAKSCQFKTLLVLSGNTKMEHLENWQYPEAHKPDYYIDSLDVLNSMILNIFPSLKK